MGILLSILGHIIALIALLGLILFLIRMILVCYDNKYNDMNVWPWSHSNKKDTEQNITFTFNIKQESKNYSKSDSTPKNKS